jgi:hypothetical protein
MTHPTDLDLRKEDHDRRVDDVNRHGWRRVNPRRPTHQPSRGSAFVAALRGALSASPREDMGRHIGGGAIRDERTLALA